MNIDFFYAYINPVITGFIYLIWFFKSLFSFPTLKVFSCSFPTLQTIADITLKFNLLVPKKERKKERKKEIEKKGIDHGFYW